MAEVKWIKIVTDIFDNRKIKQIEKLPEGDGIIVIWFKLLSLAGNVNDGGAIYLTKEIPYTEEMLAIEFNRPIQILKLALVTFQKFKMIEIIDDVLYISSWEKYQNTEALEKIREQNRIRQARYKEKQKAIESNVTITLPSQPSNATEEDIDIDIDKDIERDIDTRVNYQQIADMYNNTCVSFPKVKSLSNSRKKAIKARLNTYKVEQLQEVFAKAEASDFLKGSNNRNWSANFDWLIKDANMAKTLDGNYDNKEVHSGYSVGSKNHQGADIASSYDLSGINRV